MPHLLLSAPVLFAFMVQYITGTGVICNVFYYLLCMCEICICSRINKRPNFKKIVKVARIRKTESIESKVVEPGFGKGRL